MSTLKFYYSPFSVPSRCVWMILEELGLPYEGHILDLAKGDQKTEEYKKINVRQLVPAIKDGDLAIGESRAVAAYLVSQYGDQCKKRYLYPSENKKRAVIDQHLYIGENMWDQIVSYVSPGGVMFRGELIKTDKVGPALEAVKLVESFLSEHKFTASDDFTIADYFYYAAICIMELIDFELDAYPKILAWKKKMSELPYHQQIWQENHVKFRDFYKQKLKETTEKNC